MKEKRKPKRDNTLTDAFTGLRGHFSPVFEERRKTEELELPKRSERLQELHINIRNAGGVCPVQIEGHIKGKPFYFRARGEHWSIGIGVEPIGSPQWYRKEYYGEFPEAGWMPMHEAYDFLIDSAKRWIAERRKRGAKP